MSPDQVGQLLAALFIVCASPVALAWATDIICRIYFRHKLEYTRRLIDAKHGGTK